MKSPKDHTTAVDNCISEIRKEFDRIDNRNLSDHVWSDIKIQQHAQRKDVFQNLTKKYKLSPKSIARIMGIKQP